MTEKNETFIFNMKEMLCQQDDSKHFYGIYGDS